MKLVINGDDFGYTMANTLGIVEAYEHGILRSTTALSNSRYLEEAARLSKEHPGLGVGVHLNLTLGKPLTKNKTLTNKDGNFYPGRKEIWLHDPDYEEIRCEWEAQIERFIEVFGRKPTHLDSHHSVHDATPMAYQVSSALAKKYDIPLRRYSCYKFVTGFYGPSATADTLIQLLEENKDSDIEIMTHPGYCDLELYRMSSYATGRVVELDVLCDLRVLQYVKDKHIELCSYERKL